MKNFSIYLFQCSYIRIKKKRIEYIKQLLEYYIFFYIDFSDVWFIDTNNDIIAIIIIWIKMKLFLMIF